ncbi:MAG TPA: DUF3795 domain-containing protein [Candidatus Mcinerneyibacteriales bacterium]|nr:DUF3795 domain-containing protein [Candidatus Mcinerneyibacteriales bacterium]HPE19699.1 DUF3795 domain-containing protein [Candidatus Mcinerneyibacteriales bacterium]HPJ70950.1 DUF3795 domain-containing protein [Candidatus Mcinerneyibacteriales bacterium]HPQ88705.1 DUF3795 domain-containing protein [Candidatus Mcinerneyibacteriales bacterium]
MKMIAACGLLCHECPAFLSHRDKDKVLQEKTAREWSRMYETDLRPEDIRCTGCQTESEELFSHCLECSYRTCAHSKGLATCAECTDYPCEDLQSFFTFVPEAKTVLDSLKKA